MWPCAISYLCGRPSSSDLFGEIITILRKGSLPETSRNQQRFFQNQLSSFLFQPASMGGASESGSFHSLPLPICSIATFLARCNTVITSTKKSRASGGRISAVIRPTPTQATVKMQIGDL
jgi:hypothetical protein